MDHFDTGLLAKLLSFKSSPSFLYHIEGGLDKPTSDNKYGMSFDARPFSLVFSMIMH